MSASRSTTWREHLVIDVHVYDAALYYRFSVRSNACHTSENDRVGFD